MGKEDTIDFSTALVKLKAGQRVTRAKWNGQGQYLEMQVPDEHSKMRKPYIYIKPVDGELVPWVATQTDLLADDWEIVTGEETAKNDNAEKAAA